VDVGLAASWAVSVPATQGVGDTSAAGVITSNVKTGLWQAARVNNTATISRDFFMALFSSFLGEDMQRERFHRSSCSKQKAQPPMRLGCFSG
jgi:hypothetical protein